MFVFALPPPHNRPVASRFQHFLCCDPIYHLKQIPDIKIFWSTASGNTIVFDSLNSQVSTNLCELGGEGVLKKKRKELMMLQHCLFLRSQSNLRIIIIITKRSALKESTLKYELSPHQTSRLTNNYMLHRERGPHSDATTLTGIG